MRVDLPGMTKDNVKVEVSDGQLTLTGEREEEKEQKEKSTSATRAARWAVSKAVFQAACWVEFSAA